MGCCKNHIVTLKNHNTLMQQVTVFSATVNPFPFSSQMQNLKKRPNSVIIIPLDLYVISVSNGSLSLPPCHYPVYKCQFLSEGALTQPPWVLPRNTTPHTACLPVCSLPPHPLVEYRPPIYRAGEACNPGLSANFHLKHHPWQAAEHILTHS